MLAVAGDAATSVGAPGCDQGHAPLSIVALTASCALLL